MVKCEEMFRNKGKKLNFSVYAQCYYTEYNTRLHYVYDHNILFVSA